jgi:hypothetical protein
MAAIPLLFQCLELRLLVEAQDGPYLLPGAHADIGDARTHFLAKTSELLPGLPEDGFDLLLLLGSEVKFPGEAPENKSLEAGRIPAGVPPAHPALV